MTKKKSRQYFTRLHRAMRAIGSAIAHYGSLRVTVLKALRVARREGWMGIRLRAQVLFDAERSRDSTVQEEDSGEHPFAAIPLRDVSYAPNVSVIVPSYNHAPYLRERLDSIYSQTYAPFEVILLDDGSTDGSREILLAYAERHAANTRVHFNEHNSGGVFQQWRRGLELARGDLVWIAESDDYCQHTFLAELVAFFKNEAVSLAFCRTSFVNDSGTVLWTTEEFLEDRLGDLTRRPFVRSAHWLVNRIWGVKNVIPNVSSAVFRNPRQLPLLSRAWWPELRLCGDWIFYLHIARGGLVAYTPESTNFYRQHASGTALAAGRSDVYFREMEVVARELLRNYRLCTGVLEEQQKHVHLHWRRLRGTAPGSDLEDLYSIERVRAGAGDREPNVLIVGYALVAGGGETFPIILANELKHRGGTVSFLNLRQAATEPAIRRMLEPSVPLFELSRMSAIGALCKHLGVDVVHSHHAWSDMVLADHLQGVTGVRQIITMHGMYEMLSPDALARVIPKMKRRVDKVIYTAEKNRLPFDPEFQSCKGFTRIDNALGSRPLSPVPRDSLGIDPEDFVLCLVSRAIPEKGWEDAIHSVRAAQKQSRRRIHLVLIGSGEEHDRLRPVHEAPTIHFLGFRPNIRDFFAMADMGFLPTRFAGESAPLVLIDCLRSGRPVVATRIGEIPRMLRGKSGMAGVTFDLHNQMIDVPQLGRLLARLASDSDGYAAMAEEVQHAVGKFDTELMVSKYENAYRSLVNVEEREVVTWPAHA